MEAQFNTAAIVSRHFRRWPSVREDGRCKARCLTAVSDDLSLQVLLLTTTVDRCDILQQSNDSEAKRLREYLKVNLPGSVGPWGRIAALGEAFAAIAPVGESVHLPRVLGDNRRSGLYM